ncbi:lipoprotein [Citrobacter braakii]|nr:lipoprotein [Citrobacter braakii]
MGVNGGSGISLTGSPVASSVPAQPGVTIGGLTIPAAPTDAQITGGSGRVDAVYISGNAGRNCIYKANDRHAQR